MNRGLKEIYNQISDSLGLIDYKLNLYNPDNNLFINIPLFNTLNKSLNLSLIYNHQNRNILKDIGKGFSLNYYMHLDGDSINPYLVEADKMTNLYSSYYTSMIDERTYDLTFYEDDDNPSVCDLTITDFRQNEIYMITQRKYPDYINLRNGYQLIFDFDQYHKLIRIKDKKNNTIFNKLEFTYKENTNLISKIKYYDSNDVLVSYVKFCYDETNNYLTKIRYKSNQNVEVARLEFQYNSSYLLITTYDSNVPVDEFKYNFNSNNKITSIYDKFDLINSFTYYNEYTVVSDKYNNQIEYHFKDNKLSYTKDSYSNITYFEYDIYDRLILNINNINLLDNTYNMISNINSSYYFNLNPNNKYMLIILTNNEITLTLKGTIYSNSNEDDEYIYDYYTINGFKILFINVYDLNEIFISNPNYVEKIMLIKNKDYTKYEYNNKSYIKKIETLKTNTICTYDNNGNMLTSNDGITSYTYTYDSNNNMLTKTDYNDIEYYTYDEYNNMVEYKKGTDENSTVYEYNSNNLIKEIKIKEGVNGPSVSTGKRTYTYSLKLSTESKYFYEGYGDYNDYPTNEYTYDSLRRITKIRNTSYYNQNVPDRPKITLDINKTYTNTNLTNSTLASQTLDSTQINYDFEYDTDHRLVGLKYNYNSINNPNSQILEITYNPNNDIYTYNMYGNIYEYNYNLNSSINNIKLNNNLICSYLYDNRNNLIRLNDNLLNSYITYSYDLENRINHMEIYGMNKYVKYDEFEKISEIRYQNNYFNLSSGIKYIDNYMIKSRDYNIDFRYDYIIFENGLESINHKHELDESKYYMNGIYAVPNSCIKYKFSEYNTNEFTIFLEMYDINTYGKIVEFNDLNHYIIIENINNKIVIKIDNNTYNTNYSITSGLFNIFMTYGKTEEEIDNDGNYETYNDYKFIFERNNQRSIYSYRLNSFNYSNVKTIIYKPIKYLTYEDSFNNYYDINVYNKMKDNKYNESILSMRNQNKIQYCCLKDNNSNNILYNGYSYNSSDQLEKIDFDTLDIENIVIHNNMGLINENKLRTPGSTTYLLIYSYEYDMLGRVREEKQDNVVTNTYTYYNNGDIKTYDNKLYVYENGILVSIDNNPLTYTNKYFLHTYLGKTYDWTNNRLTSYNDGNTTYYYEYDYKGLRRKKIYNNITTTYYYDDNNRLMFERKVNSNQVTEISYIYDMKELIGFKYNGNRYYYIKDILGNIIYIINENKNILVAYKYSAYGIIEETGNLEIRNINHFKYKSYYYDEESNMYYLITRYYLPSIGRFISPDDINYIDIDKHSGYNLYSYCNNNPVMYNDPDGKFAITLSSILIGMGIGAALGFAAGVGISLYQDYKDDLSINGSIGVRGYLGNILASTIAGVGTGVAGVLGAGLGVSVLTGEGLTVLGISTSAYAAFGISVGVSSIAAGAGYSLNAIINPNLDWSPRQLAIEMGIGAMNGSLSFIGGFIGGFTATNIPGLKTPLKTLAVRLLIEQEFTLPLKLLLTLLKGRFGE